ncbi:MAG: helix-turn-helix transcriptional regulator [Chitinispirillaceae bacterium]|nr:helix-turn-helix transcriptional regulator [Chitinispirillaceae bacterium]
MSKLLMNPKELLEIAIKDATCLLIPDAAKKVFTGQGYMNARLEDIIAAAGFAKPSFYSYYPDYEATFNILAIRGMNARALMTGEADDINLKIRGGC